MAEKRRVCAGCGLNRAERFFASARARKCSTCLRKRRSKTARSGRLLDTYGLSPEDYEALLEAQGGVCAICKGSRGYNLDVDHSHALEAEGVPMRQTVRGLLCKQCNRQILRHVRDRVLLLEAAIAYLTDPPARKVLQ